MQHISVKQLQRLLDKLWAMELKQPGSSFPIALYGTTGAGKSSVVLEWASKNGVAVGATCLSGAEKADLIGKLGPDGKYITPLWALPLVRKGGLIFLDEFNRIEPELVPSLFSLVHYRKTYSVDLSSLPTIVILAANPASVDYDVGSPETDRAFRRRFVPFLYDPTPEERVAWVLEHFGRHAAEIAATIPVTPSEPIPKDWVEPPEVARDELMIYKFLQLEDRELIKLCTYAQFGSRAQMILQALWHEALPITANEYFSFKVSAEEVLAQPRAKKFFSVLDIARNTTPERLKKVEAELVPKLEPDLLVRLLQEFPTETVMAIKSDSCLAKELNKIGK